MGHHPHPAPTPENPERWDCDYPECRSICRSLTPEQIRQKYAHLAKRKRPEAEQEDKNNELRARVTDGTRLLVAHQYAAGMVRHDQIAKGGRRQ